MLSNKAKRELKIDQRQILIDSIEIGIPSPQQILTWGERELPNGEKVGRVKNSKTVNYKRFTPFRDGLFCERIFGPVRSFVCACGKKQANPKITFCEKCCVEYIDQRSRRYRLGYISLVSSVTHIWYLKGRPSYLSLFLGKRKKTIVALAYCNAYLVEHALPRESIEEIDVPKDSNISEQGYKASFCKQEVQGTKSLQTFSFIPKQSLGRQLAESNSAFGKRCALREYIRFSSCFQQETQNQNFVLRKLSEGFKGNPKLKAYVLTLSPEESTRKQNRKQKQVLQTERKTVRSYTKQRQLQNQSDASQGNSEAVLGKAKWLPHLQRSASFSKLGGTTSARRYDKSYRLATYSGSKLASVFSEAIKRKSDRGTAEKVLKQKLLFLPNRKNRSASINTLLPKRISSSKASQSLQSQVHKKDIKPKLKSVYKTILEGISEHSAKANSKQGKASYQGNGTIVLHSFAPKYLPLLQKKEKTSFSRDRGSNLPTKISSPSYAISSYVRAQALPFFPSFICNFYLRDAILSFLTSKPGREDIPLMAYCSNNRCFPLRDVHKFMAEQTIAQSCPTAKLAKAGDSKLGGTRSASVNSKKNEAAKQESNSIDQIFQRVFLAPNGKNSSAEEVVKQKGLFLLTKHLTKAEAYKAGVMRLRNKERFGSCSLLKQGKVKQGKSKASTRSAPLTKFYLVKRPQRKVFETLNKEEVCERFQQGTGKDSRKYAKKASHSSILHGTTKPFQFIYSFTPKKGKLQRITEQSCCVPLGSSIANRFWRVEKPCKALLCKSKDSSSFPKNSSHFCFNLVNTSFVLPQKAIPKANACLMLRKSKQAMFAFNLGIPLEKRGRKAFRSASPAASLLSHFAEGGRRRILHASQSSQPALQASALNKAEGKQRKTEQALSTHSRSKEQLSRLEVIAIREILSYTGGGALQRLLQRFTISSLEKFLLAETEILRRICQEQAQTVNATKTGGGNTTNQEEKKDVLSFIERKQRTAPKNWYKAKRSRRAGFLKKLQQNSDQEFHSTALSSPSSASLSLAQTSRTALQRSASLALDLSYPLSAISKLGGTTRRYDKSKAKLADRCKAVRQGGTTSQEENGKDGIHQFFNSYQDLPKKQLLRVCRRLFKNTRRLKITQLFSRNNRRPEWMLLSHLPVLPPDLRPILQMSENFIVASDLNNLYQRVIYRNNRHYRLRFIDFHLVTAIQRLVQDAVDRLLENGKAGSKAYSTPGGRALKSLSDILKGKKGRFRLNLLGKRVDFSGRSVIVVSPSCKIQECGLPRAIALELYHYFLLRQLMLRKHCSSIVIAKKLIKEGSALIWQILRDIVYHHPVLLNRAPTLHRLGIQAFQPKLVLGNAILLHPLVCGAFNADFDGDQMGVHLPLCFEARAETWDLLWSRNNLLSPATGQPMLVPSQDMVLGFYYMTSLYSKKQNFRSSSQNKTIAISSQSKSSCSSLSFRNRSKQECLPKAKLSASSLAIPRSELESITLERSSFQSKERQSKREKSKTSQTHQQEAVPVQKERGFRKERSNFAAHLGILPAFFFVSSVDVIQAFQKQQIALHTPVWLKWSGKIQNDGKAQKPIELRVNSFGSVRHVYSNYEYFAHSRKILRSKHRSTLFVPPSAKRGSIEASRFSNSRFDASRFAEQQACKVRFHLPEIDEEQQQALHRSYYIRTTAGRVIMNNFMQSAQNDL